MSFHIKWSEIIVVVTEFVFTKNRKERIRNENIFLKLTESHEQLLPHSCSQMHYYDEVSITSIHSKAIYY